MSGNAFDRWPSECRLLADIMPGGRFGHQYWEALVAVQVKEIKTAKPEYIMFRAGDCSAECDFMLFKNDQEFVMAAGDCIKLKARYKIKFSNFTGGQAAKISPDEMEAFHLECQAIAESQCLMREAGLPPNYQHNLFWTDFFTNVERKQLANSDEVDRLIFEALFFRWLDWGETHADMQPNLRLNDIMQLPELQEMVRQMDDEWAVRQSLQRVLDVFKTERLMREADHGMEIDLEFFRTFTEQFLAHLARHGAMELMENVAWRDLNEFIAQNNARWISMERFKGYMADLYERRLLDFPNQPKHYRLREA